MNNELVPLKEVGKVHSGYMVIGVFKKWYREEHPELLAYFMVPKGLFLAAVGWELKDCFVMAIPEDFKYREVKSVRKLPNQEYDVIAVLV